MNANARANTQESTVLAPSRLDSSAVVEDARVSAVSWAAILAGGAAAAAISLMLLAFGAGMGFAAMSPWSGVGVSTTFRIATGLYFIVMAMLASSIGGYLAGRLRARWQGAHTREVFFRDTAHGLLAWAFASLLSFAVLGSAASSLTRDPTSASARMSGQGSGLLTDTVSTLLRGIAVATPDAATGMAAREEASQILAHGLTHGGEISASDSSYLAQLVAARTGASQAEAEQRVAAAVDEARTTVNQARKAASQLALWLCASLLVGAFVASLAAVEGGGLRDGTWKYQV
jgi:hypothetical protein